jgi:hypothetical protein
MNVCTPVSGPSKAQEIAHSPRIRSIRPSLLDPYQVHEPRLSQCVCMPNTAVLYLMNRPIAVIQATAMDQATLDRWLTRIRNHEPRTLL